MDSFVDHGVTHKIEQAPALWRSDIFEDSFELDQYHGGLHVDPGTSEEPVWSDPEQGTTTCDAIRLRISAKCYEYHGQLGLPRGKLIKETKQGMTLLVSLDDIIAFKAGAADLWYNYTHESQDRQTLWNKAGFRLYWRAHRIATSWIDHIESAGEEEEENSFYPPFNYEAEKAAAAAEFPAETKALSLQHAADLQAGIKTRISITEFMIVFLHELGVTPEIPHPDAPEWDYGSFEVTPTTLDDLEQRCTDIADSAYLNAWKEVNKVGHDAYGHALYLESGLQFSIGCFPAGQVGPICQGLLRRINKARATLEEKAQNAGR